MYSNLKTRSEDNKLNRPPKTLNPLSPAYLYLTRPNTQKVTRKLYDLSNIPGPAYYDLMPKGRSHTRSISLSIYPLTFLGINCATFNHVIQPYPLLVPHSSSSRPSTGDHLATLGGVAHCVRIINNYEKTKT